MATPRGISLIVRPHLGRFIARLMIDDDVVLATQLDSASEHLLDRAFHDLDRVLGERDPGPLQRWWADVVAGTPGYEDVIVAELPIDTVDDEPATIGGEPIALCTCGPGAAVEYHGHYESCPLYVVPPEPGEDQLDGHNQLPLP